MRPSPYQWPLRFLVLVAPEARVLFLSMAFGFGCRIGGSLSPLSAYKSAYREYKTKFATLFLECNHTGQTSAKHKCNQQQNISFTHNCKYNKVAKMNKQPRRSKVQLTQ